VFREKNNPDDPGKTRGIRRWRVGSRTQRHGEGPNEPMRGE